MRIVFMGTPDFALPSLRLLQRAGHDLPAAVTQPDRPRRRRSGSPGPSPVKVAAQCVGIPVLDPESVKDPTFIESLKAIRPEAIVVVAYGQILPPEILALPPRWCINVHASLLPKYRGAAPIAGAIMAGEKITGVTTVKMDRGLDTGDILLQRECAIGLTETAGELGRRLADLGAEVLVETLDLQARGAIEPRKQKENEATQAPPLTREDGRIDWSRSAQEITNQVRGCNPWPLAVTYLRGEAVTIHRAEVGFEPVKASAPRPAPGQGIADAEAGVGQCQGDSRLNLLPVPLPGRQGMTAREGAHGRLLRVG